MVKFYESLSIINFFYMGKIDYFRGAASKKCSIVKLIAPVPNTSICIYNAIYRDER